MNRAVFFPGCRAEPLMHVIACEGGWRWRGRWRPLELRSTPATSSRTARALARTLAAGRASRIVSQAANRQSFDAGRPPAQDLKGAKVSKSARFAAGPYLNRTGTPTSREKKRPLRGGGHQEFASGTRLCTTRGSASAGVRQGRAQIAEVLDAVGNRGGRGAAVEGLRVHEKRCGRIHRPLPIYQ